MNRLKDKLNISDHRKLELIASRKREPSLEPSTDMNTKLCKKYIQSIAENVGII
jgi:hypothetical protein